MNPDKIYTQDKWAAFDGFSPIISLFRSFHNLTPEIEFILNTQTFPVNFKKNKFISSPLHRNKYIFFVLKGTARGYMKEDNKEITTWIAKENELIGNIRNLWDENEPTEEYVQAIEDVVAIAVPHAMSRLLYTNFDIANYIGRKMTQLHYLQACERAYISRLQSAEKRYIRFIKSYPELVNRVPLKHIASFLCMRLETLSRIRSKLAD
ncbi:Crp/Fnr family transcriptional regulator [Pedobacter frigidisoli]|uniref:Crp/Fnr family transcriptional regulator n=1 Tax=Pedobacter frigidisoli TaxID=2530455 RepID=A0A4R0P3S9_9SPHI|nr:cyclic nucleotide-binding domain-containing protein [Pedobacter frigidisoli]TCD08438.1 Crp/Fnr family transcriptional regulator [Pedobacter frigidisoli]